MGRSTVADKTPLLEDAEENIGSSKVVNPQAGAPTVIPQTNPDRVIMLQGGSGVGQSTTITVAASRILQGAQNPNPGFPGPITGVLEFGNGARSTKVEFDVPVGPFAGFLSQAQSAIEPQDGGTIVTVPTGIVRLYARYDNLLLAPVLNTDPPRSLAEVHAAPLVSPGGPLTTPTGLVPAEPVLVKAMATYFSKAASRAYRTLYLYVTTPIAPTPVVVGNPAGGSFDFFCLPAFCKTFQILRVPSSASIDVHLADNVRTIDQFTVNTAPSPIFRVGGREVIIGLKSTSANDTVTSLLLVCEVGV